MDSLQHIELPDFTVIEGDYIDHKEHSIFMSIQEAPVVPLYKEFSSPDSVTHEEDNHFILSFGETEISAFYIDESFNLEDTADRKELVSLYKDYTYNRGFWNKENFFLFCSDFQNQTQFYWKNDDIRLHMQKYKKKALKRIEAVDEYIREKESLKRLIGMSDSEKQLRRRLTFINTDKEREVLEQKLEQVIQRNRNSKKIKIMF